MWLIALLVLAIAFIIFATAKLNLHAFLALLLTAFAFGILAGLPLNDVVKAVNDGFGGTIGSIGIVILLGTVIGTFLEKSGGAWRLAESILNVTGKKNVPMTMSIMGYVVSIPVFCDSGFVILSSLNKALAKRAGITLAAGAIALSLGLYSTHTMVPPTPGPIAAAGILKADLGLVIMWGLLIAAIAAFAGWVFAVTVAAKVDIPPYKEGEEPTGLPDLSEAPSPLKSLVPIVLPIVLIVVRSIALFPTKPFGAGLSFKMIDFIGQPVVALLLGFGFSLLLPKKLDKEMLSGSGWFGEALLSSAAIIIITGAGGSFGKVLQISGIAKMVGEGMSTWHMGMFLPFVIAAGIKTAQGSSTVAIITTAGIMTPLLSVLGMDSETARALVVVAIGAGSMVVSHANDSYFWVVTQFSNMDAKTGYRLQTGGTLIQGLVGGISVWATSMIVL
jgi:GntP family gluconate:H+ symporter